MVIDMAAKLLEASRKISSQMTWANWKANNVCVSGAFDSYEKSGVTLKVTPLFSARCGFDMLEVARRACRHLSQDEQVCNLVLRNAVGSLEHVSQEVMPPVVATRAWILVMPISVVDRNLHFGCIAIIHTVAALIRFGTAKVLWIEHVWVVVKAIAVTAVAGAAPRIPKSFRRVGRITRVSTRAWSRVGIRWRTILARFALDGASEFSGRLLGWYFAAHGADQIGQAGDSDHG